MRYFRWMLPAFGLLLAVLMVRAEDPRDRAWGIAMIRELGGTFEVDEKAPGQPIVAVDLGYTFPLAADLEHLKGLTRLQSLKLNENYRGDIGDGLAHIKGMTDLRAGPVSERIA